MITLKTLPQATAQEVFDQVASHLLKQGKKSMGEDGRSCVYLSPEGLKCAAGCLIGEEEYKLEWENFQWSELATYKEVPDEHFDLINSLQAVHDNNHPYTWENALKGLAEEEGLEFDLDKLIGKN